MGIPSYFSYIIKNHAKIVRKLRDVRSVQHLYMDCNSIIYDLVHASPVVKEDILIEQIMEKIRHYINYIQPTKTVFVAFDGVAPLAKMDQQRTRRHKTLWTTTTMDAWSTCNITPGTPFMNKLSTAVKTMASETVMVSTSMECGEGEHKLFQHIREMPPRSQDTAVVYGLDSDLIMLSLFHCDYFKNLYVFRETPEFIKSQIPCDPGDPCHFLDIRHLSTAILREMNTTSIYDYVFMCFLLGNDFLPHFPALNLRTHGIDILVETYKKTRVELIVEKSIQWSHVKVFFQALAKRERELWRQEYVTRDKWANRSWSTATPNDRDNVLQNVPVIYRAEEMYIAPKVAGWESRYYKTLLPHSHPDAVCKNYMEGLAWVFQYYTQGCTHWRFRYKYHYPPLLRDLGYYLGEKRGLEAVKNMRATHGPYSPAVQLAYVIPQTLHATLLEPALVNTLLMSYAALYKRPKIPFQWAFCRYFWESHVLLPEIPETMLCHIETL